MSELIKENEVLEDLQYNDLFIIQEKMDIDLQVMLLLLLILSN